MLRSHVVKALAIALLFPRWRLGFGAFTIMDELGRRRPYVGQGLGEIAEPTKKTGRDWEPPEVSMDAPAFCKTEGFSQTTCFECTRATCYFDDVPERINRKHKKTKTQLRQEGLLPALPRRQKKLVHSHPPDEPHPPAQE